MTPRSHGKIRFKFQCPEQLEPRSMLSGHTLALGLGPLQHGHVLEPLVAQVFSHVAKTANELAAAPVLSQPTSTLNVHLGATLSDSNNTGATGSVGFESKTGPGGTHTELVVRTNLGTTALSGTPLQVSIDGTVVGTITPNSAGVGKLVLKTLPTGLTVAADSVVTVADVGTGGTLDLTGTLAPAVGHGHDESQETHLGGTLADLINTTATGTVFFETESEHGTTSNHLVVKVDAGTTALSGTPLQVSVDGTVVGTITPDANGVGKLVLSTLPTGLTVAAGSVVTVADVGTGGTLNLTTTLAVQTDDHGEHGESHRIRLAAALTDLTNTSATASASFKSETEHAAASSRLTVKVNVGTTALSGTPLEVSVDGTVVGTITPKPNGVGKLILKTLPTGVNVTAGSVISVADVGTGGTLNLTGTLATPTKKH